MESVVNTVLCEAVANCVVFVVAGDSRTPQRARNHDAAATSDEYSKNVARLIIRVGYFHIFVQYTHFSMPRLSATAIAVVRQTGQNECKTVKHMTDVV